MQLDSAYEIQEFSQADGIMVTSARERSTGKPVQFHVFPPERSKEAAQICERIMSLPEEARRKIIKFGKDGAATYFLTEPLGAGQSIVRWMAGTSQAPPPPQAAAASGGPGEFTRTYQAAEIGSGPREEASPPLPAPSPAQSKGSPGFTQLYSAEEMRGYMASMQTAQFPPPASEPAPPAAPPPSAGQAPGLETFIGMKPGLESPAEPARTPPAPPPAASAPTMMTSGTLRYQKQSVVVPAPSYSRPAPVADPFESTQNPFAPPAPAPQPPPAAAFPTQQSMPQRPVLPPPMAPARPAPRAPAAPLMDWKIGLITALVLTLVGGVVVAIAR